MGAGRNPKGQNEQSSYNQIGTENNNRKDEEKAKAKQKNL